MIKKPKGMASLMKDLGDNNHIFNIIRNAIPNSKKKFIHRSFNEGGQEKKYKTLNI